MKNMLKTSLVFSSIVFFVLIFSNKVSAQSCSPTFPSNQCDVSNSVTITANVPESSVTFSGFAPWGSIITFKEADSVIGTAVTGADSQFTKTISAPSGIHNYILYLIDTEGNYSPEIAFNNIGITNHTNTAISNIHLPPTIKIAKSKIFSGETLTVSGQGPGGSSINLFLNGKAVYSALISSTSKWSFNLNSGYSVGENLLFANLSRPLVNDSENSLTVKFTVEVCNNCPPAEPEIKKPEEPTKEPSPGKSTYDVKINIGLGLGENWLLFSSIIITSILLLVFLLIIFARRKRKRQKEILKELEEKVERDLHKDNPDLRIEKDFWEAEKEW